jgi:hypothetical protein
MKVIVIGELVGIRRKQFRLILRNLLAGTKGNHKSP